MEEELKRLVAQAIARGATNEEIERIISEYGASKKKGATSQSASPSVTSDSTGSSFGTTTASIPRLTSLDGVRVSSIDDVYDKAIDINGYVLTDDEEIAVKGYVDNYDNSYNEFLQQNFNPGMYLGSYNSELPQGESEESLRQRLLQDIDTNYGLQSDEGVVELLRGVDQEFSSLMPGLRGMAENMAQAQVGMTLGIAEAPVDQVYNDLFDRYKGQAEVRFRNSVTKNISKDVLGILPEELRDDKKARNDLERAIFQKYQIPLDLNGDGYINKGEDRSWASESVDGLLAATFETVSGLNFMGRDVTSKVLETLGVDTSDFDNMTEFQRMQSVATSQNLRKDMRIPLNTMSEKFESGDPLGGASDGLAALGESVPMMTAAIVTGAVTKNPKVTAGVVSLFGSATSYNRVRDEEWFNELDSLGKVGYVSADGIAEGLPALVGANIFNRMRALGAASKIASPQFIKGFVGGIGLGMVEEGVTEAVTAGMQYANRVLADDNVEWNDKDFTRAVKDGWYGGVVMGGAFGTAGTTVSLGARGASLALTSIPSLRSKLQIKELQAEYEKERDPKRKAELGERLVRAVQGNEETSANRRAFYDFLAETAPEVFQSISDIQTKIAELSMEHNKTQDGKRRGQLKKQIRKLVEERSSIEAEYEFTFESDAKAERDSILKRVAEVDEQFNGYGDIFQGDKDSVTVDGNNADSVLESILRTSLEKINLDIGQGIGVISTVAEVRRGLTNAIRVAKALQKIGVTQGIVIHKTLSSMQGATGGRAARGMAFQDGKIHLLMPALRSNTAYHEGFHTFVVQELGQAASRKLAAALVKSMGTELVEKYRARLSGDMVADITNLKRAIMSGDFAFADEFLMEVLADLSDGQLELEVQKGMLRNMASMLAPYLAKIGVRDISNPKIEDLKNAIVAMTSNLAEGKAPDAKAVADAVPAARVRGISQEDEVEQDVKTQGQFQGAEVFTATLQFITGEGRKWTMSKKFNGKKHMDNFINYMERKGYQFDEVFYEPKAQGKFPFDASLGERRNVDEVIQELGLTREQLDARFKEIKLPKDQRQKPVTAVAEFVDKLVKGEITQEDYIKFVREEMPITPFTSQNMPAYPSVLDISAALYGQGENVMNQGIVGVNKQIPDGYWVGLRLDIPSYNKTDVWTVSIHQGSNNENKTPNIGGKKIGFAQTAKVVNGVFNTVPKVAADIGRGFMVKRTGEVKSMGKSTIARMFGEWVNHDPDTVRQEAIDIMNGDQYNIDLQELGPQQGWVQVGMNPYRHSWFYDKRDGRPIDTFSELIQVGPLVLAKDTVKIDPSDSRFSFKGDRDNEVKYQGDLVKDTKDMTVKGERIGQGRASRTSKGEVVTDPGSYDGTLDVSIQGLRAKDEKTYIQNARYLANLDIVQAVKKFQDRSFNGKKALAVADEVYRIFVDEVSDNLVFLHDKFNGELRDIATLWYDGANIVAQELSTRYDMSVEQVSAVIAALSPQKDWYQNLRLAELVIDFMKTVGPELIITQDLVDFHKEGGKSWAKDLQQYVGQPFTSITNGSDAAAILWAYADLNMGKEYHIVSPDGKRGDLARKKDGSPKKAAWGSRSMIASAMDAVTAVGPEAFSEILGNQHKIRNFYNNIANPGHGSDATIDTHAVAAAHLKPFAGANAEVIINLGGSKVFISKDGTLLTLEQVKKLAKTKSASEANAFAEKRGLKVVNVKSSQGLGLSGMYYAYLDAYRQAAEARGILPREMQSITWEAVRLLYTAGFKQSSRNKAAIEALHKKYTNGELTKEQLRDALLERADGIGNPDWADVFTGAQRTSDVDTDTGAVSGEGRTDGGEGTGTRGDSVVREQVPPVQSDGSSTGDAKFQGDLTKLIADFLDKNAPSPKIKGKKKPKLEEATGGTLDAFVRRKKEIMALLKKMGYSKEVAESIYQNARAYKAGRSQGQKSAMRVAKKAKREADKLGTEAATLRKDLQRLKEKSKTVNQFFAEAIKLVEERMKGKGQQPFSRAQIERLFKIARMAHKVSAKSVEKQGFDAMETFIEKLTQIFDQQDAKAAMAKYLKGIQQAKALQKRLAKLSKTRKKGESLKGTATYRRAAQALSKINPALLPEAELQNFLSTLAGTLSSMSKAFAEKNEDGDFEGVAPLKIKLEDLNALVSNFQAMEELGRDAAMVARATNAAKRNKTSFDEEYDKLKKKYERSKTSATVNAIRDFIEDHNSKNPGNQLDPANPADIQFVLDSIAKSKADVSEEKMMAVINDVIIPRVAANLSKLMEDKHVREILGFYHEGDFSPDALRSRLSQLSFAEIVNIDYKLDDYILNNSVFGLGYVAAMVRGKVDYAVGLARLQRRLGLKAKNRVFLSSMQTIDSMLRQLFPIGNLELAKLRRFIGFGAMEGAFAQADAMHARVMEQFKEKVLELGQEKVATVKAKAIAQIFSMARQIPQGKDATPEEMGIWYNSLKEIMRRSIDQRAEQPNVAKEDIQELNDAYSFLFDNSTDLESLQELVRNNEPEIVEMVDFVVSMHEYVLPMFQNYVERFLGKELEMEDNYTAFDVMTSNEDVEVEQMLQLRRGMLEALRSSSLSNAKKVAGGSFERNPRSITGKNNTIGLDFFAINERRMRENIILSKTVGHVATMRFVFKSKAMSDLVPQKNHRKDLELKMMGYIQQDTGTTPTLFKPTITVFGQRMTNPLDFLRNAVVVKLFGSVVEQTLKQGGVVLSAMGQFQKPLHAIPYLTQTIIEMAYYSLKTGFAKDSKIVLDRDGRYRLLENSPVFSRDYEAGNIDPFTGAMRFNQTKLSELRKVLTDLSLKNLKGTDKIAAVATWFAYYGDYLIENGKVDSFANIDWEAEAQNPNVDALSYADGMITKDQAASTPRQAADAFRDQGDAKGNVVRILRTFVLPFARFPINKKMSILGDIRKFGGDATSKKEAASAMLGHTAELAAFHSVSRILVPWVTSLVFPDDPEEAKPEKNFIQKWGPVITGVVNDFLPIPPFPVIDDYINHFFTKYIIFGMAHGGMWEDDYASKKGQTFDEMYKNWQNTDGFKAVYNTEFNPEDDTIGILRLLGPIGDFSLETMNLFENVATDGNKVISPSGREYFVRPEDKEDMELSQLGRLLIAALSMSGLNIKEAERIFKAMDDLPMERKFNSEEELGMYETVVQALQEDDYFKDVADLLEEDQGLDRLLEIIQEHNKNGNLLDAKASLNKAKQSIKSIGSEHALRTEHPDLYRKYIRELRKMRKSLNAEDLSVLLRNRRESMTPTEYREFDLAVKVYFGIGGKGTVTNAMIMEALYELNIE